MAKRDSNDMKVFKAYLTQHSPFEYDGENSEKLVCIANGVIAHPKANPDKSFDVGEKAAAAMDGSNFSQVKLKRSDKVISMSAAIGSVNVREVEVEVDSTNLLLRAGSAVKKPSDMKEHLTFEFDRNPPSLFLSGVMRKNTKSCLARELKDGVDMAIDGQFNQPVFVIDGGYLLHILPVTVASKVNIWPGGGCLCFSCDEF